MITYHKQQRLARLPLCFYRARRGYLIQRTEKQKALQVNIAIMRVFVEVRRFMLYNNSFLEQLKELRERLGEHDVQLNSIYDPMENLLDKEADNAAAKANREKRERIGYKKAD